MISGSSFRIVTIVTSLVVLVYASTAFISDILSSNRPVFPSDPLHIAAQPVGSVDDLAAAISPFKSDIQASLAMKLALQALSTDNKSINERAQDAIRSTLSTTPTDSENWLALSLLIFRSNQHDRSFLEALKMSYLTAPNDATLIPARLDMVAVSDAVTDSFLAELARSDIRLALTRQPDLRDAILSAYRRGSAQGKAFMEGAIGTTDPAFLTTLRDGKPQTEKPQTEKPLN